MIQCWFAHLLIRYKLLSLLNGILYMSNPLRSNLWEYQVNDIPKMSTVPTCPFANAYEVHVQGVQSKLHTISKPVQVYAKSVVVGVVKGIGVSFRLKKRMVSYIAEDTMPKKAVVTSLGRRPRRNAAAMPSCLTIRAIQEKKARAVGGWLGSV